MHKTNKEKKNDYTKTMKNKRWHGRQEGTQQIYWYNKIH